MDGWVAGYTHLGGGGGGFLNVTLKEEGAEGGGGGRGFSCVGRVGGWVDGKGRGLIEWVGG